MCGDNYQEEVPRQHETGGKFGNEIISGRYLAGSTVDIEVHITANHTGFFVLKLCPVKEPGEIASQSCLDQYPLEVMDSPTMVAGEEKISSITTNKSSKIFSTKHIKAKEKHKFTIPRMERKPQLFKYKVRLPQGVTCDRCVLQWTYVTASNWDHRCLGCGPQEWFRNCADIQIKVDKNQLTSKTITTATTTKAITAKTTEKTTSTTTTTSSTTKTTTTTTSATTTITTTTTSTTTKTTTTTNLEAFK